MLGSITPLGERGRGSRWWLTVSAYVAGVRRRPGSPPARVRMARARCSRSGARARDAVRAAGVRAWLLGLALDLGALGLHAAHDPSAGRRRLANVLSGMGLGLGLRVAARDTGVVTIVTSSTVYSTWFAAFLTGRSARRRARGAGVRAREVAARVRRGAGPPAGPVAAGRRHPRRGSPLRRARAALAGGAALAAVSLAGAARW